MDESEFRKTYRQANDLDCPFEKSILSRQCSCEYSLRFQIADREAAGCRSRPARGHCAVLLDLLRRKAQFALGLSSVPGGLPHAKEMKVQVGGLLGLQNVLELEESTSRVKNIHALVRSSLQSFGSLERIPFQEVVRFVASYQGRRKKER